MAVSEKAFTIRLRGAVLDRLLREAEEAGQRPTPYIERLLTSTLNDEARLQVLTELEALQTSLHEKVTQLRADLVTTTQAILFELRSAVSGRTLSAEEKQDWQKKVSAWTESLRQR